MTRRDSAAQEQLITIGAQIRRLRKARGFSQEGFALHAGLPRAYMGQVERGERNLSVNNLVKIALGLNAEPGELFPPLSDLTAGGSSGSKANVTADTSGGTEAPSERGEQSGGIGEEATYLSTGAVAGRYDLSSRTLQRWAESGVVPARYMEDKSGKRYAIFHPDDVARAIGRSPTKRSRRSTKGSADDVDRSNEDGN